MSDRSFIRPVRIPGKRVVLTKGMIEESQNPYSKYEAILTEPEMQEAPGGDNPAKIPGGVSQTSRLASGEDLRDNSAGLETLRESGE